jgi:hypothetical protein
MQYYHNHKKVWEFEDGLDMSSFNSFIALTDAQINFYLSCREEGYNATLDEVLNVSKNEPVRPSLEEYKAQKITEMSWLSLSAADKKYPEYKKVNALLGLYTEQEVEEIKSYSTAMRNEFYRLKGLIEAAVDTSDVDAVVATAKFEEI